MFYEGHRLLGSDSKNSFFREHPKYLAFTSEDFFNRLHKVPHKNNNYVEYFKKYGAKEAVPSLVVSMRQDGCSAFIQLKFQVTLHDGSIHNLPAANVSITTVNSNCGAIHMSGLTSPELVGLGYAKDLFELVLEYLKYAGYTFLFGNTAGYQNNYVKKLESWGFKRMAEPYINPRSRQENIWLFKFIQTPPTLEEISEEDNYDEDNYDENRDDEEENF